MTPYEVMLSESQERMLILVRPEAEAAARQVFEPISSSTPTASG